ncbi:MAG TPA: hypothetical protein IAA29_14575 [Candidatus Paenibacillus intestinavium]|nr:hypothetical protein [Candidatus Paenibacillus intestinavium]
MIQVLRKRMITLTVIATILFLSGCGLSKEDVMKELIPTGEGEFAIHLFYDNGIPESETKDLNIFHNSNPTITNAIGQIQFWDHYQERNVKWAKALEIKEFPKYLIVDKNGNVFETPYLSVVKEHITTILLPE